MSAPRFQSLPCAQRLTYPLDRLCRRCGLNALEERPRLVEKKGATRVLCAIRAVGGRAACKRKHTR
eukprot:4175440-Pyramimonas_sp.AAC.2